MRYEITANTLAAMLLLLTSIVAAQNQLLKFEVATVKPSPPPTGFPVFFSLCHGNDTQVPVLLAGAPITVPALGRCLIRRSTLSGMIAFAYPPSTAAVLPADRVTGGPGWITSDAFDVEAKAENADSATNTQLLACSSSY